MSRFRILTKILAIIVVLSIITGVMAWLGISALHDVSDRADTMVFHLGMSGRWRIDPTELELHDHLLLETDSGHRLALNDPRRFGSVDLVPTEELVSWGPFAELGPEPFDLTAAELQGRSVSDFVVAAAQEVAHRTIEETSVIRLSIEDQQRFVDLLLNPPAPTPALQRAAQAHAALIQSQ